MGIKEGLINFSKNMREEGQKQYDDLVGKPSQEKPTSKSATKKEWSEELLENAFILGYELGKAGQSKELALSLFRLRMRG